MPKRQKVIQIQKKADILYDLVSKQAAKYKEVNSVEFGGSYAKGTWLEGTVDLDIFVKMKTDTAESVFEKVAKQIGFDSLKGYEPYLRYSEHPYVEAHINGTRANVVPCYDVQAGNWKSAADRSSFHTRFIKENLDSYQKDQVRMLKKFLIGIDAYGAEIAKSGFSGYVSEVLVYYNGSFLDVIQSMAEVGKNQVFGNPSRQFDTPIVIIDPIDSNRNLAAAISTENLGKLCVSARSFLKKPSVKFFGTKQTRDGTKAAKTGTKSSKKTTTKYVSEHLKNTVVVQFEFSKRSPDQIWGQLKRAASGIKVQLELAGFVVYRKASFCDEKSKAALMFFLESPKISGNLVNEGPPFFAKKPSEDFVKKNSKKTKLMWIDDSTGKIISLQDRGHSDAQSFLCKLVKENIKSSGVPSGLFDDIKKTARVYYGAKASDKSIKKELQKLLTTDELIFFSGSS